MPEGSGGGGHPKMPLPVPHFCPGPLEEGEQRRV